jgi:two-component system sensor histidine kinase/response regulator
LLTLRSQEKGIELGLLFDGDVPRALRGDEGRLRQVLTNLIGNAVKFTNEGRIVVQVNDESTTETQARLRFKVSDTGIGISAAGQSRVFEAFAQADGSMARKYGGTGLGLAISKQLVDLMGGEIGFESIPGEGSTFWFTGSFEQQPDGKSVTSAQTNELNGLRILIVDDSLSTRQSLLERARAWGMLCGEAETGAEALALMRAAVVHTEAYDVAI